MYSFLIVNCDLLAFRLLISWICYILSFCPSLNSLGANFSMKLSLNSIFFICLCYQAVLETVARVKSKKNDTKEEKYVFLY
jgi:hypothetical protein